MTSVNHRSVLIVEDEESWRDLMRERSRARGWSVTALDNVPQAFHLIHSGDTMFDVAIVDGHLFQGWNDRTNHQGGYAFLEELATSQPWCINVLISGIAYEPKIHRSPELNLQVFFDKRHEPLKDLFDLLASWETHRSAQELVRFDYETKGYRVESR